MLVVKSDGSSATLTAGIFIAELGRPQGLVMSTSPSHLWLSSFGELNKDSLTLTNANGEKKVILFKDLEFQGTE